MNSITIVRVSRMLAQPSPIALGLRLSQTSRMLGLNGPQLASGKTSQIPYRSPTISSTFRMLGLNGPQLASGKASQIPYRSPTISSTFRMLGLNGPQLASGKASQIPYRSPTISSTFRMLGLNGPQLASGKASQIPYRSPTISSTFQRHIHSSLSARIHQASKQKKEPAKAVKAEGGATAKSGEKKGPSTNLADKVTMYQMPLFRHIRHLRMVFLVNVFCSTAISLWVRTDDIYTVFAAGAIMLAGFVPLAFVQLMYRDHIKQVDILGGLNKRLLARARKAEARGESQIEFPVSNDTPLYITKYSATGGDPSVPLYVRDLAPGPSRRFSVQWVYRTPFSVTRFRVSKKIIQYHPDIRALDRRIRENAKASAALEEKRSRKPTTDAAGSTKH